MGSHEGEPPTRERMPGVTRPLSHTLQTRVADGFHVLRPCAEALTGAHVPRHRLRGTASLCTLKPRVSAQLPSYLRLRAPPFSAPSFIFTFFHPPFFITGGAACTGGASTASLPANHHLAASLLAEPPCAVSKWAASVWI